MRTFLPTLLIASAVPMHGQGVDEYTGHFTYAFIEDGNALVPLGGNYSVEYLARGMWWSYTDPRLPVNYAGRKLKLRSLIEVGGSMLQGAEPGKDWSNTDQKLRVVRCGDTLLVDLSDAGGKERRMRERTATMDLPPRPPVLIPFRRGWSRIDELIGDPVNVALTAQIDSIWREKHGQVRARHDTARYEFSLLTDDLRTGPANIFIERDPNYRTQMLLFPASGPGVTYELTRQDERGMPDPATTWSVAMDPAGETPERVDITGVPPGRYTVRMLVGSGESTFFLILLGPSRDAKEGR